MAEGHRKDEIQGQIVHVYDDIEEADNQLPRWWLATFYGAIAFAVGYWFYYHEYQIGPSPVDQYAAELAAAAARGGTVTNEMLDAMSRSSSEVSAGATTFASNCAVCHGDHAQGNIGPNLTDNAWIHGGDPVQIHDTIRDGVSSKGMPSWGASLGPQAVRQLAAYVVSLRNTNVAGKEPQGEPWVPGGGAAAAPANGAAPAGGEAAPAPAGGTAPAAPAEGTAPAAPSAPAAPTNPSGGATAPTGTGTTAAATPTNIAN